MKTLVHVHTLKQIEAIFQTRGGSYIFHGPAAMGKATAAAEVVRALNCRGSDYINNEGHPSCEACRQLAAGSYPDLINVHPEDKPSIVIEQVRALSQVLSLSPYYPASVRVVIIDGADSMTTDAQNALLKLIEEPPPQTLFILIAEQVGSLLPTVRSRCGEIFFAPLPPAQIAGLLEQRHHLKPAEAAPLAAAADGAPGAAVTLLSRPGEAAARAELAGLAADTAALGLFERLLLAKRLIDSKADILRFANLLHHNLIAGIQDGRPSPGPQARQLAALELFRRQMRAKVSHRVALERLMLEL